MVTVLLRTLLIYTVLELSMKLMGKRQIGEFQLSELVTTLFISELAVLPISDPQIPLLYVILPLTLIISLEVITSFVSLKSSIVRRFFSGKPSVIIRRGKLDQHELLKLRISCSELLAQLRQKGFSDISDVYYAIIEDDGILSVFPRRDKRPPNTDELDRNGAAGEDIHECGIAHSLIIDGDIIEENLRTSGKNRGYIEKELRRAGCRLSEVFLFTCDDAGNTNIIKKEN